MATCVTPDQHRNIIGKFIVGGAVPIVPSSGCPVDGTREIENCEIVGNVVDKKVFVRLGNSIVELTNPVTAGTVTSVGLTMPTAFTVANSPVTTAGTINVTANGIVSQYIRGDGTLSNFPSVGGGGSSFSYFFNGGNSQGVILGNTYYEISRTSNIGASVSFNLTAGSPDLYFITDANDPGLLNIPLGTWNIQLYIAMSSAGGSPAITAEILKYDGASFTSVATSAAGLVTGGTSVDYYIFTIAVPSTVLAATDRIAVKLSASSLGGRTMTVYTQDTRVGQMITSFSTGISALNGLTADVQYFTTGTAGADFNISSTTATHTFNLPTASAVNRGALSSADWTTFNNKVSTGAVTSSGLTMATARILGRTTAGTGAIEEISIGSGLSLAAGTLSVSGGGAALSAITAAVATNSIDNTNYVQDWLWSTLGAGEGLHLQSASTAAASNTQTLFKVSLSGANATASQTTYASYISNTHSGTTPTNVGQYINVTNADAGSSIYGLAVEIGSSALPTNGVGVFSYSTRSNYEAARFRYGTLTAIGAGDCYISISGRTNQTHTIGTGNAFLDLAAGTSSGVRIYNAATGSTSSLIVDSANRIGARQQTPTAWFHIAAGAAAASSAPLKFTSGTNLTTPENGAMEYNGTDLFFTKSGATRGNVIVATAVTTEAVASDTTLTITYQGTTYKILARV